MKPAELKSAIDNALEAVTRYAVSRNYQIAVYSDGSNSGLLEPHTWEPCPEGVYELCRVNTWYDESQSDNKNKVARRQEKKAAFEAGLYRLNQIISLV